MAFENVTKISYKNEVFNLDGDSAETVLEILGVDTSTVNLEVTGDTLYIIAKSGTKGIVETPESSVINGFAYTDQGLVIQFKSGGVYLYPTVTEATYKLFQKAESKGSIKAIMEKSWSLFCVLIEI